MKAIVLFPFLFLISFLSFGQKIHFADSSNRWVVRYDQYFLSGGHYLETYFYNGSQIINGNRYLRLFYSAGLIREDTVAGKVYIRRGTDTTDKILFDYNWVVGDSVQNSENVYAHVIAVDSTQINNIWYKVWHFYYGYEFYGDTQYFNVIEGIGCTSGIDLPATAMYTYRLLCFQGVGADTLSIPVTAYGLNSTWDISFDNAASCAFAAGVDPLSKREQVIRLFPNPVNEDTRIVFPAPVLSGSFVVVNTVGEEVVKVNLHGEDEVKFGDKINAPGIYFYRVTDNNTGKAVSGKFVFE